jgi:energy-coupling factor transport system permease protein
MSASAAFAQSRLPRALHPGAWWLWALGLAAAASRTTNPLLLGLVVAVAAWVVAARRTDAPWARSFQAFLRLGLVFIAVRLAFEVVFGAPGPGTVLVALPEVGLPEWAAGVRLGGPVTLEALVAALYDGMRLFAIIACLGAANALANPSRLLKSLPGALYEVGVAVVVTLTVTPQLVIHAQRLREARRLRGRAESGPRAYASLALPVLEGALDRSLALAAAMDSRGFGRTADRPSRERLATGALTLGGLLGVCAGAYGLLDAGSAALAGAPLLIAGVTAAAAGLALGSRRSPRTRYRPDPWAWPETAVAASGLAAAALLIAMSVAGGPAAQIVLQPATNPLEWPTVSLLAVGAILLAALPSVVAPAPPSGARAPRRSTAPQTAGPTSSRPGDTAPARPARVAPPTAAPPAVAEEAVA